MKDKILSILALSYVNGSKVCLAANISPMKWQNVKRGYDKDFTEQEKEELKKVFGNLQNTMFRFLQYKSESKLKEILNERYVILSKLLKNSTTVERDRILRFKRGEAVLGNTELKMLSTAIYNFHQTLLYNQF